MQGYGEQRSHTHIIPCARTELLLLKVFAVAQAVGNSTTSAATRQGSQEPFYRPELDCLRFFAFLGVFVHHSIPKEPSFFRAHGLPVILSNFSYAGAFGVDLFFCLSAYLITKLLLREKDLTGHLNVKAFYVRRILRIWPLYFAFVFLS